MARSLRRRAPSTIPLLFALAVLVCPRAAVAQSDADLIIEATAALPEHLRVGATVRIRTSDGSDGLIREGSNGLVCWPDDPVALFCVFCMDASATAYVTELRRIDAGTDAATVAHVNAALNDGTIPTPPAGARFYWLRGPDRERAKLLIGIWLPDATAASTGLPTERGEGTWLMCPGTRRAHIMIGDIPYGQDDVLWETCGKKAHPIPNSCP